MARNHHTASLVGMKFGALEVLDQQVIRHNNRMQSMCYCRCSLCGSEKWSAPWQIKKQTDCGCNRRPNLLGRKFGRLTVTKKLPPNEHGDVLWQCSCECGGTTIVPTSSLTHGYTHSCGCRLEEIYANADYKAISEKGVEANIVDSVNLSSVRKKEACKNNKLGIRGVFFNEKRGYYIAAVDVHGEHRTKGGFSTPESAKKWRDQQQEELIKKWNVKL